MNVLGILVGFPFLALLPAVLFAFFYSRSKRRATLVATLAWFAYFFYEQAIKLRIMCSGDCNIRVDLLLFYPLLLVISVLAVRAFRNFHENQK